MSNIPQHVEIDFVESGNFVSQYSFLEAVYQRVKQYHESGLNVISVDIDSYTSYKDVLKNGIMLSIMHGVSNYMHNNEKQKPQNQRDYSDIQLLNTSIATIIISRSTSRLGRKCNRVLRHKIMQASSWTYYVDFVKAVQNQLNILIDNERDIVSVSFDTHDVKSTAHTSCLILYCAP